MGRGGFGSPVFLMLNIVCVNSGNYLGRGAEYVNKLFDMVARNLAEGHRGRFVCFTDDPWGLDKHIVARALPGNLKGWWNKLYLFKDGLFEPGDRILYFDLDTLITGRLDEIAAYDGDFAILRDFYGANGWGSEDCPMQSAVMAWPAGKNTHLWDKFVEAGRPDILGGDQAWIGKNQTKADFWQDMFPRLFESYKVTDGVVPAKASVICFHGKPRPHEIDSGWVPDVWKIGGITRAELDVVCNTAREVYMANVRENCKFDLPWLGSAPAHEGHVAIVGGAPSVKDALGELAHRKSIGQKIWALNGAFGWLCDNGITPDAHFIIDARIGNIAFLRPTKGVKYYLASQCHPDLFYALGDYDVTVVHMLTDGMEDYMRDLADALSSLAASTDSAPPDKPIHLLGGGTTVGMKAMLAAHQLGYRKIHLYGMDSSYADDVHHAYDQEMNGGERLLDVICGERKFKCAPWMVTQATDFQTLAQYIAENDGEITVNGDGLLPWLALDMMRNPSIAAADIRAAEILKRLGERPMVAELGVFAADLSTRLLAGKDDLRLVMVDAWSPEVFDGVYDDFHAHLSGEKQDAYARMAKERTDKYGDRRTIVRARTTDAAKMVRDKSFDAVFIDADHSYEGCLADIHAWHSKVKPGGWLMGHDYANDSVPEGKTWGVDKAVDEFAAKHGYELELGENFTWFIKIPEAA